MHFVLATVLGVAGPPATEPVVAPTETAAGDAIGIVWHDQATVEPAVQQWLADELVRRGTVRREAVVMDASTVARARVARELPRDRVDRHAAWQARLDEAIVAYRAGEIESAEQGLADLLEQVRGDPTVPGAASLAWRAHVVRAQLARTQGDDEGLVAALTAAVALDPEATLSTRQVPPPVAEAYAQRRAAIVADAASWPTLSIAEPEGGPQALEIDGVPGARPVPPGEHLVVVRRPGHAPLGTVVDTSSPWSVPASEELLATGLPVDADQAEAICQGSDVAWLMLARVRGPRLGLQRYTCGEGFGPAWYQEREGRDPGVELMLSLPPSGWTAKPVLHLAEPWPKLAPLEPEPPVWVIEPLADSAPRQRLRRALPWVLIGGVVAGAVTLGVVLGTDPDADLAINGNSFLRP